VPETFVPIRSRFAIAPRATGAALARVAAVAALVALGGCAAGDGTGGGVGGASEAADRRAGDRGPVITDSALARDLALAAGDPLPTDGDTALSTIDVAPVASEQSFAVFKLDEARLAAMRAASPPAADRTAPPRDPATPPRPDPARTGPATPRRAPAERAPAAVADSAAATDADANGATESGATTTAAATATAPGRSALRILAPAGSAATAVTASDLCTEGSAGGDRLVARLASPLRADGDTAGIADGTPVLLEVVAAPDGVLRLRVRSIALGDTLLAARGTVAIPDDAVVVRTDRTGGDSKRGAVVGAIAGAVLGRVLGGGTRGTVAGAAAGGAVGAAAGAGERRERTCLPAGSTVRLTLEAPVVGEAPR
jgi:hypothetical protein